MFSILLFSILKGIRKLGNKFFPPPPKKNLLKRKGCIEVKKMIQEMFLLEGMNILTKTC